MITIGMPFSVKKAFKKFSLSIKKKQEIKNKFQFNYLLKDGLLIFTLENEMTRQLVD